jgi:hypothetical protein
VLQANIILNNELKGEGNEYVINNLWATQNQESYEPSEIEYNLREDVRVLTETIQQLRDTLQLTVGYLNLNDPHERHAFNEARILFKELRND